MLGNALLEGKLVRLTPPTQADLPSFARWFADLDMQRMLSFQPIFPLTMADEEAWFAQISQPSDTDFHFSVRRLDDDALVGNCGLMVQSWRSRAAILGITIGEADQRGRGYGSDAIKILLRFGFLDLNLNRIALEVHSFNARAIAVYKKLGFVYEGAQREAILRDGQYHDTAVMSVLRAEWTD